VFRASEGTLSRWSRLHLQSLAPTPVSRRVDVRQAAGRKNIFAESLSQHDEKHVVPTPLSGIRVEGRRNGIDQCVSIYNKCQDKSKTVQSLLFASLIQLDGVRSVQHVFHHVVIKIRKIFLLPAVYQKFA
jgi:hypothetical protein